MNKGKIVQVIGPVVDVRFEAGQLPALYNAIRISNPSISDREGNLVVEVAQHLGGNVVRCVAMDSTDGLARGRDGVQQGVRGPCHQREGPLGPSRGAGHELVHDPAEHSARIVGGRVLVRAGLRTNR